MTKRAYSVGSKGVKRPLGSKLVLPSRAQVLGKHFDKLPYEVS